VAESSGPATAGAGETNQVLPLSHDQRLRRPPPDPPARHAEEVPGDWGLGGPPQAVPQLGVVRRRVTLLCVALAVVVALLWAVDAGCSNVYDRGTACKVDPTLDCEKPWHGPSYTRPDKAQSG
jgi:hypothetical protein